MQKNRQAELLVQAGNAIGKENNRKAEQHVDKQRGKQVERTKIREKNRKAEQQADRIRGRPSNVQTDRQADRITGIQNQAE